ncbi:3D domain-containing protein [Spongiimicrobium sp. 3-5]|uniref:3D domain-containing protein n=1 Tax=Spongiimicrobium sp. 3-5 TaxID=3332596 RepID=UPI0039811D94
MRPVGFCIVLVGLFALCSCEENEKVKEEVYLWNTINVTATAYNSLSAQTDRTPNIAAWGDTLSPGMKCIAVSRDLIALGLKHNTMIKLDTFPGIYLVKDKMHRRWKKRIDIYMGINKGAAKQWGKRKLTLQYAVKKDSVQ